MPRPAGSRPPQGRAIRSLSRGASALWSIVLVAACAAFLGVAFVTYWVSTRGGYLDRPVVAQAGIARIAHAAIGRPEPPVAASALPDAGDVPAPPETATAVASAPSADPEVPPIAENDVDAGDMEVIEVDDDPPTSPVAKGSHPPPSGAKATKKRRVRKVKRR